LDANAFELELTEAYNFKTLQLNFELATGNWKLVGEATKMFILDSLLIGGIKFALEKVAAVVDQELDNPETLHHQLLEAQMDFEEGRIDKATFSQIEQDLLARMRELKQTEQTGGIADAGSFEDVEVEILDDR